MNELDAIEMLAVRLQEGGPGSGRQPTGASKGIRGGKNKILLPGGGTMKVSDVTYHIAHGKKNQAMCGKTGNAVVVPGGNRPAAADIEKVGCPRCLSKYAARAYRASEETAVQARLCGNLAAVGENHRPDYGTFVIPPIEPAQMSREAFFGDFIMRQLREEFSK